MSAAGIRVTIDGCEVTAPAGTNLIEAARLAGIDIPHFCYHPKLSVSGNCRMCLVEVGMPKLGADRKPETGPDGKPAIQWGPKLTIGCNTPVAEGMVVRTRVEKVDKARRGVMEFLLVNHPLDCPICDQAGECRLQELAVDYGRGASRFVEEKEHKPKKVALGPKITLDDERCILCSRCIRFMREIAGQDCLGFVERGGRSHVSCYPGQEPATNYDLNIVDLCPVGALTSNDFRFRQRVWFLRETPSICPHCATGCNIVISSREDVVLRQTPRDNEAVNQCWMCDYGRLAYRAIHDPRRLRDPSIRDAAGREAGVAWPEAIRAAADRLRAVAAGGPGRIAFVGSARATTEELRLLRKLADALGAGPTDVVPHAGESDSLLLDADRTPNLRGARLAGIAADPAGSRLAAMAEGIRSGAIRAMVVAGEDVAVAGLGADLLARLDLLVAIDRMPSATTAAAHIVLPGASYAEKSGTYVNRKNRIQLSRAAIQPPGSARPDGEILGELLEALGGGARMSDEEVFAAMAAGIPELAGLTWEAIGLQGVALDGGRPRHE